MTAASTEAPASTMDPSQTAVLNEIQRRVLWLSTLMIHHANRVRPNPTGIKVGGHQASSTSVVTVLTYLFFRFMRAGDRISVKPHASPVLHAIHYLLGNLDESYLTTLRQYHGLQAYPSRTKDPDPIDFSTGSMGLGSVAPNYAALVDSFVQRRFGSDARGRYFSVLGDGELDEGSIWEAIAEPALADLDNVIWVVDVNRQSLDRVIPGIRVRQLEEMFRANGWEVIEAKYGRRLQRAFGESAGRLRQLIDEMSNEDYQFLLRAPADTVRASIGAALPAGYDDAELHELIADLGGHDFDVLAQAFARADAARRPAIVFAYTVKGWGLPIAGDPLNHQALLTNDQIEALRERLGIPVEEQWQRFSPHSEAGQVSRARAAELQAPDRRGGLVPDIPHEIGRDHDGIQSTQRTFGLLMTIIGRDMPQLADRMVTISPDVAISTNLGGWINKVGVWDPLERRDPFLALGPRLVSWQRGPRGRHIELGISETNLMMALGQLGLSAEMTGEPLFAIGTLYDPFVARALEALMYGLYAGSRFIVVGTPSGISLASEGGAHQSVVTPPLGLAIPGLVYWEPCFAQELEWILLAALRALHRSESPEGAYLRLSTAPVDQALMPRRDRDELRAEVLSGAYRIVDRSEEPGYAPWKNVVEIWAAGVVVVEAITASTLLNSMGIKADVVNCTSPDLVFRAWRNRSEARATPGYAPSLPPPVGPVVSVIDGHPSTLGWIGSMRGVAACALGVARYGESGTRDELYRANGIDANSIADACTRMVTASRTAQA